ncbi:MAG: transporter suffix domain-containing protein [Myxococcota bacterium]
MENPHFPEEPAQDTQPPLTSELEPTNLPQSQTAMALLCIALSFVMYGALFLIPFLPLSKMWRWSLFLSLFLMSEILFWGVILLLGKETFRRYRRLLLSPRRWLSCSSRRQFEQK